jgi:diguanylate cyclase (GGDEF)-like protein
MATHDSLTGLHNRASLTDALQHAVSKARRNNESLAVFFIDLDGFKTVNDTLGHATGDHLLREIARRLRAKIRDSDLVARLGGDEFVVMVESVTDRTGLQLLSSKILATVGEPMQLQGHEVTVTTSIGIAIFPDDGADVSTLLANADLAMYRAKALGHNRANEYSADLGESVVERFEIEKGLRDGLLNDEFRLYYQPKIEFSSGKLLGVEALIRWHHPTLGVLGPDRFIHVAEATSFIIPLGKWVIEQACRQASAWRHASLPHFSIAVNLSPHQLTDLSLVTHVSESLRTSGADPSMLEFEITETAVMKNLAEATALLESLRDLGVRLAIDSVLVAEAEIGFDDARVGGQFGARPGQLDLAGFQHVAVVGTCSAARAFCSTSRMATPVSFSFGDDAEDFLDDQRRQAEAGLVEHQQLGLGHQGAAHGQHLALAAGQRAGQLGAALFEAREELEDFVHRFHVVAVAAAVAVEGAEQQVVLDAHFGEQFALFRHQRHAVADQMLDRRSRPCAWPM